MISITQWNGLLIAPLLLCSIVALGIIAERSVFVLRRKTLRTSEHAEIFSLLAKGDIDAAAAVALNSDAAFQPLMTELLRYQTQEKTLRDEAISLLLGEYAEPLQQRLSALTTIAALAPMLGLLGTIAGLMHTFYDIGLHQGPIVPSVIADGLWQALITTAVGMVIAVICVLAHALINARIRRQLASVVTLLNRFSLCMATGAKHG